MRKNGKLLIRVDCQLMKCRKNDKVRKSVFGHHSNNLGGHWRLRLVGENLWGKAHSLKCLSTKYVLVKKGKIVTLQ